MRVVHLHINVIWSSPEITLTPSFGRQIRISDLDDSGGNFVLTGQRNGAWPIYNKI